MGPLSFVLIVLFVTSLSFSSTRSVLSRAIKGLFIQLVVAALLLAAPVYWWDYNDLDLSSPAHLPSHLISAKFLISTGSTLIAVGFLYRCLPIDLVPDFLPIIGKLDNLLAGVVIGIGISVAVFGYKFGVGPHPESSTQLTEYGAFIYHQSQPYVLAASPYVQAVMEITGNVARKAYDLL